MNRFFAATSLFLFLPLAPAQDEMQMPGPGPQHEQLHRFVGTWTVTVKNHMVPGDEPMIMTGTDTTKLICNGMWLQSDVHGVGMPFEGFAFSGWDMRKNKYVGVWIDSTTAAPSVSEGTWDEKTSTFTFEGEMATPEGMVGTRSVVEFPDADTRTEKVYLPGPDGEQKLGMELICKRSRAGADTRPAAMDADTAAATTAGIMLKQHAPLKMFAGDWKATVTMDMPGLGETKNDMKQTDALLFGGLWVHTHAKGAFMGMPFEGHGLMGYDPIQEEYVSYWVDSMGAIMMEARGEYDTDTGTFTMKGESIGPNGPTSTTETTVMKGGRRKMTMESVYEDGSSAGTMTIDYHK